MVAPALRWADSVGPLYGSRSGLGVSVNSREEKGSGEGVEGERRGPRKMMIRIGFLKDK